MTFSTPLRYPGGKARLGPWLGEVMRHNSISGGWYVEPYAGGAGAALFLLMQGYVDHILINDADPVIYSFWKSATCNTKKLVRLVQDTPVTMSTWYEQQKIIANPSSHSCLKVGFATFFLNRTNRSGILSGGVIGGKSQEGDYRLDARFNKDDLIQRIETIGAMAKHITVRGDDALDLLEEVEHELPEKSLIYLDPPYFYKGSQLYRNHYGLGDHEAIAQRVSRMEKPVLVTYDNAPEIDALYVGVPAVRFSLRYSTHDARPHSTEVLFYRNLELPRPPQMTRASVLSPAGFHETTDVVPECVHE